MANVLLIGNGAREHAIAEAITRSKHNPKLFSYMKSNNPGIASLSDNVRIGDYDNIEYINDFAKHNRVDIAVIGPEDPLNNGVVDSLKRENIPSVGPTQKLAQLETSKSFTRNLLKKYRIPGNPVFRIFSSPDGIKAFIESLDEIVIKPDGLTGGKGVMVQGDHFHSADEAIQYCIDILKTHPCVIIEEKLDGEEFSLQCLCDGVTVVATPPVQDHKRRFADDQGPNTGGMGSYSLDDLTLPFLKKDDIEDAIKITQQVAKAIYKETGEYYKGIMYGGFIITKKGVKLLEYNARFGDPEAMNILPLMKTDFIEVCQAIINGNLGMLSIEFDQKASVCKYIVPKGYGLPKDHPDAKSTSTKIEIKDTGDAKLYYASVEKKEDGLYMTASRAIGVVGIAETLERAELIAEEAASSIEGEVDHRRDIGTNALIKKRMRHMSEINK